MFPGVEVLTHGSQLAPCLRQLLVTLVQQNLHQRYNTADQTFFLAARFAFSCCCFAALLRSLSLSVASNAVKLFSCFFAARDDIST